MKISYAITVCNEVEEIVRLIEFLKKKIRKEDEIIILADYPKVPQELKSYLLSWNEDEQIKVCGDIFDNDFSKWKNKLTQFCTGDYIFQIDADELPNEFLVQNLHVLLKGNAQFDVFLVPRINTVIGIESADLLRWNWKKNENEWINFPDYQWRIYRNHRSIHWINKVHERLVGFKEITCMPATERYSLIHKKTITKQIKQNFLYKKLGEKMNKDDRKWPKNTIKECIYRGRDPFEEYQIDEQKVDISGWGLSSIFEFLIKSLQPKLIIEVGTWKGNSAIHMALLVKDNNLSTEIVCVDHFMGSEVHWLGRRLPPPRDNGLLADELYLGLGIKKGRPSLYETFMHNCVFKNVEKIITPFPTSSDVAFFVLEALSARPEIIYIDGGHEYESVSRDLGLYSRLLNDQGVLLLDDYGTDWPGVTLAAHEFIYKNPEWKFFGEPGKAVLTKKRDLKLRSVLFGQN